jgi:hypothetical protein
MSTGDISMRISLYSLEKCKFLTIRNAGQSPKRRSGVWTFGRLDVWTFGRLDVWMFGVYLFADYFHFVFRLPFFRS